MSLLDDLIINAETIAENYIGFLKGELTEFDVPTGLTKVRNFQFAGWKNLDTVVLHENIAEIGDYAFFKCSLNDIEIPDEVTKIGHYAFSECLDLEGDIVLPSGLRFLGSHAFERTRITSINVPGTIRTIPYGCFQESLLRTVVISHGVTSIGNDAFYGCSSLATVYLPNTMGDYTDQLCSSSNSLNHIILENGYNSTLNASRLGVGSTQGEYVNWIVDMLNALADRTGLSAKTLTLGTNNLNRLTSAQIQIATDKNWNLA